MPNACMNKYYFGHTIANSIDECLAFCIQTNRCKSVDYGSKGTCLINYLDRTQSPLLMGCDHKNNEEWDYFEMICDSECADEKPRPVSREDVCNNDPTICSNGGVCETVQIGPPAQSFTYNCSCPCNWCGKHCEKCNKIF